MHELRPQTQRAVHGPSRRTFHVLDSLALTVPVRVAAGGQLMLWCGRPSRLSPGRLAPGRQYRFLCSRSPPPLRGRSSTCSAPRPPARPPVQAVGPAGCSRPGGTTNYTPGTQGWGMTPTAAVAGADVSHAVVRRCHLPSSRLAGFWLAGWADVLEKVLLASVGASHRARSGSWPCSADKSDRSGSKSWMAAGNFYREQNRVRS